MLFNKRCNCDRQMGYQMPMMQNNMVQGMECPVVEPTINKCVEREFYHEVPQDCFFMIEKKEQSIQKYFIYYETNILTN